MPKSQKEEIDKKPDDLSKISESSKRILKDSNHLKDSQNQKFIHFQKYLGVKCP